MMWRRKLLERQANPDGLKWAAGSLGVGFLAEFTVHTPQDHISLAMATAGSTIYGVVGYLLWKNSEHR